MDRFPCLRLAIEAGKKGGTWPAALCAADEVAVELFLVGKIRFTDIPAIIEDVLGRHRGVGSPSLEEIIAAGERARPGGHGHRRGYRQMILTIVAGIIVLSVLIIVHELGHFIAAKATGAWVEEFGVGFPPRLWGKKIGETIYSINWVPFGGFNKLSGEVDPTAPRALAARSHGVRLLVLSGGILMNLLLPFVLMAAAYMVPHDMVIGQVQVTGGFPGFAGGDGRDRGRGYHPEHQRPS